MFLVCWYFLNTEYRINSIRISTWNETQCTKGKRLIWMNWYWSTMLQLHNCVSFLLDPPQYQKCRLTLFYNLKFLNGSIFYLLITKTKTNINTINTFKKKINFISWNIQANSVFHVFSLHSNLWSKMTLSKSYCKPSSCQSVVKE